jgi:response regulator RpfG family c-di-GMP phosphodiesterase
VIKDRGTHFDPDVVDAFLANEENFIAVCKALSDEAELQLALQSIE